MDARTDILVVGAGAAGLSAALALHSAGHTVTVVGRPDRGGATRTVALFDGSIRFLDSLGVWERVRDRAEPLRVMRIVDATDSIFRSPTSAFDAREIGLDQFGWNIENAILVDALTQVARARPNLRIVEALAGGYAFHAAHAELTADGETLTARLIVAADGRRSGARRAARIATRTWDYPQTALTAIFAHERPHDDMSTEFHTRQGPCTFVPLPPDADHVHRSSLVWMMAPKEAERRQHLTADAFAREAADQGRWLYGAMRVLAGPHAQPMQGLSVRAMTAPRLALVGEAAHVFPPIGAQGLNLGLRDAAHLAEALSLREVEGDCGGAPALAAYERLRAGDVASRSFGVDMLNRTLLSSFAPLDILRSAGLGVLRTVGPLRRAVMREGVQPGVGAPRVMRSDQAHHGVTTPPVSA